MALAHRNLTNRRQEEDFGCFSLLFLKAAMIVFNIFFGVTGLVFLVTGVWSLVNNHDYIAIFSSATYNAILVLFVFIGASVILVGLLGCIGALRMLRGCLLAFACLLVVILIMEAISGGLAYMYESSIRAELMRNMNETLMKRYGLELHITRAVDQMQQEFRCCAANGLHVYQDWKFSQWNKELMDDGNTVPDSCCITLSKGCGQNLHPSNIYMVGCLDKLELFLRTHLIIFGGIALGFSCLQLFGVIFACCMARKIPKARQY